MLLYVVWIWKLPGAPSSQGALVYVYSLLAEFLGNESHGHRNWFRPGLPFFSLVANMRAPIHRAKQRH